MSEVEFRLEDCYTILGLSINDKKLYNEQVIKRAFRKMALKYHPDRNKDKLAASQFKLIFLSYQEVLGDMGITDVQATRGKSQYEDIYTARGFNVASFRAGWIRHAALFEADLHNGKTFGRQKQSRIVKLSWGYFDEYGNFHGHPYGSSHKSLIDQGVPLEKLKELIG